VALAVQSGAGTIINKDQIDDLPVIDRDFASLAKLSPPGHRGRGGEREQPGHQRPARLHERLLRGRSHRRVAVLGRQSSTFVQDWIQEFQVMANSYPAEFGTASGGIINCVIR
jgi:hypothetical protein